MTWPHLGKGRVGAYICNRQSARFITILLWPCSGLCTRYFCHHLLYWSARPHAILTSLREWTVAESRDRISTRRVAAGSSCGQAGTSYQLARVSAQLTVASETLPKPNSLSITSETKTCKPRPSTMFLLSMTRPYTVLNGDAIWLRSHRCRQPQAHTR